MIDRTPKLYIGGKQTRPDSGYSITVLDAHKKWLGKSDMETARTSGMQSRRPIRLQPGVHSTVIRGRRFFIFLRKTWKQEARNSKTGFLCSQEILRKSKRQVEASIRRIFSYAAWADKYEGRVHQPPMRGLALAIPEPFGVMGVVASDDQPLLGLLSMILPCIASGNRVVAVPSLKAALIVADFYQLLDTSDVPGGVINLVTGVPSELATVLQPMMMWQPFGRLDLQMNVNKLKKNPQVILRAFGPQTEKARTGMIPKPKALHGSNGQPRLKTSGSPTASDFPFSRNNFLNETILVHRRHNGTVDDHAPFSDLGGSARYSGNQDAWGGSASGS